MDRILLMMLLSAAAAFGAPFAQRPVLDDAVAAEESSGPAPQVTTAELRQLLSSGTALVLDTRPPDEYAMSHIPGAVNVSQKPGTSPGAYVSDAAEIRRLVPNRERMLVLYCNGPFCEKSRRLAGDLAAAGYRSVRRYQLGRPGWRAAGGVTAIAASAIRHVADLDRTAVFVDAGLPPGTALLPRMVRIEFEDVTRAKEDGRLPMLDHNTRVIVIGESGAQARAVGQRIARNAFHNVAFYDGPGQALAERPR